MSAHPIEVEALSKRYGDVQALDAVSLAVGAGEVFGLLGPNGAGKSTMVRMLTGRARPTAGSARVLGHELPRRLAEVRGRINLVAETPNVYERASARENLRLFCTLYGLPRSRCDEVLAEVALDGVADRRVKGFSTGMRQRLLLARALLNRPSVLFLDEPTRGLDPVSARALRRTVAGLAADGTTVFLTTHDMAEADELCRRVAFLSHGRIAALDAPGALKTSLAEDREVDVALDDGRSLRLDAAQPHDVAAMQELLGSGNVRTIHSREPTLADVFIRVTGHRLEDAA